MKQKILLASVVVLLLSLTTKAQIGKGSLWLGGAVGYNNSKSSDDTTTRSKSHNLILNPSIGKAICTNTVMGIDLLYSHSESNAKALYPQKEKIDSYGAGIFIRQYIPIINRLYIFGHMRAGVSFSKETDHYTSNITPDFVTENKSWSTSLALYPGVSFAVNKKFQLESGFNNLFNIQYSHGKTTTTLATGKTSSYTNDQFSAGASLDNSSTLYLGFRLLLNNKG